MNLPLTRITTDSPDTSIPGPGTSNSNAALNNMTLSTGSSPIFLFSQEAPTTDVTKYFDTMGRLRAKFNPTTAVVGAKIGGLVLHPSGLSWVFGFQAGTPSVYTSTFSELSGQILFAVSNTGTVATLGPVLISKLLDDTSNYVYFVGPDNYGKADKLNPTTR